MRDRKDIEGAVRDPNSDPVGSFNQVRIELLLDQRELLKTIQLRLSDIHNVLSGMDQRQRESGD